MRTCDVLIVGSGAGGGPLAYALSNSGFKVVVLEKGQRYRREDFHHDELLLAEDLNPFVPHPSKDPHIIVRNGSQPQITTIGWIASCVGGGTTHMGGSFYRLCPDDFTAATRFGGELGFVDWPYTYEDLEPYYTTAEWAIGVSGDPKRLNTVAGYRSREYPLPPLREHPLAAQFDETATRLGLRPFPTPRAINSRPYGGRPQCEYCYFCAGFGCPVGARGTIPETLLDAAERTKNCEVLPQCMASEITVGNDGLVSGCIYIDCTGREHRIAARLVCVCCSAIESARLLLMSRPRLFPNGLANDNGLVGQNLHFQYFSGGRGIFSTAENATQARMSRFINRTVMDYYFLPTELFGWPKGGTLQFEIARMGPIARAQRLAIDKFGGLQWGSALRDALYRCCTNAIDVEFEVFHDFPANDGTYIDLDPDIRDQWGLPVARIHVCDACFASEIGKRLVDVGTEILAKMGVLSIENVSIASINRNLVHGTCRAGIDPSTSVLNAFCQSHQIRNLFVVDGSFMPSSGGVPSTLTILANSFRTAAFIEHQASKGIFGF
jgi:choline dehydrogenase-like flavoprotein